MFYELLATIINGLSWPSREAATLGQRLSLDFRLHRLYAAILTTAFL
jgi:hypothetical protein